MVLFNAGKKAVTKCLDFILDNFDTILTIAAVTFIIAGVALNVIVAINWGMERYIKVLMGAFLIHFFFCRSKRCVSIVPFYVE